MTGIPLGIEEEIDPSPCLGVIDPSLPIAIIEQMLILKPKWNKRINI